ncbi:hypothetical protein BC828DRAFT_401074 [Blastocladiella britannica]|nr:hypothetical protein BC828DRAFT_401074 [Blastocladiella britannica]
MAPLSTITSKPSASNKAAKNPSSSRRSPCKKAAHAMATAARSVAQRIRRTFKPAKATAAVSPESEMDELFDLALATYKACEKANDPVVLPAGPLVVDQAAYLVHDSKKSVHPPAVMRTAAITNSADLAAPAAPTNVVAHVSLAAAAAYSTTDCIADALALLPIIPQGMSYRRPSSPIGGGIRVVVYVFGSSPVIALDLAFSVPEAAVTTPLAELAELATDAASTTSKTTAASTLADSASSFADSASNAPSTLTGSWLWPRFGLDQVQLVRHPHGTGLPLAPGGAGASHDGGLHRVGDPGDCPPLWHLAYVHFKPIPSTKIPL